MRYDERKKNVLGISYVVFCVEKLVERLIVEPYQFLYYRFSIILFFS